MTDSPSASIDHIFVKGAREHNLKNVDAKVPRDKLVVITGLSGSGKSSLAFDTIYAEGQRRYVESLSAYARQFLGRMEKPDVDYIEGLSPAISIDQKGVSNNPRSTVGTITEIFDHLRLLYARIGKPHCYNCGRPVEQQTVQNIVDSIRALPSGSRLLVLAPVVQHRKGEHQGVFEDARQAGFVRIRVNGELHELSEQFALDKNRLHSIEVVVDRLVLNEDDDLRTRITDSVETALKLSQGFLQVVDVDSEEGHLFSEHFACVYCNISVGKIEPRTFSFNSPHGACEECTGLGYQLKIDPDLVIPDKSISLAAGAVKPWAKAGTMNRWYKSILRLAAEASEIAMDVPVQDLSDRQKAYILFGPDERQTNTKKTKNKRGKGTSLRYRRRGRIFNTTFDGVIPHLENRHKETESDYVRSDIEKYMTSHACVACNGKRLKKEALAVSVDNLNIMDVSHLSINDARNWIQNLDQDGTLSERDTLIAEQILKEIDARLNFLADVGLNYLTLDRATLSLSGGEAQRIRLATQIGSGLMGVLYICDEPSIGLHPVDNARLIATLQNLRNLGNTIIVVEHDEAIMRAADHIIDLGPGAGENGGNIVAEGNFESIQSSEESVTGAYLSGRRTISVPSERRKSAGRSLSVIGARANNLKNVNVSIPLGLFVCITGVSGSGKSSLVYDILAKRLSQYYHQARERPGAHESIDGLDQIDKVINIDQSAIGRTPRSNPATYTGLFTPVRELFSTVPEARARGYGPGRFSFNIRGGRCEACQGDGYTQIEMQFLPDVSVPCEVCKGQRYNREALEIRFRGKNISEVLNMTVTEALEHFGAFPKVKKKLQTLEDVGLGYIRLGQPATTLSGGEAQRIKLSTELSRRSTGRTIYLLDEPTTGLSFADTDALLHVLQRLVDQGNSVVLIEHHLDIIKSADWVIDMGPGAGEQGGEVVAMGTPEEIAGIEESHTGQYLRDLVKPKKRRAKSSVQSRKPSRKKKAAVVE
ncbi:MAG: excinuclease ABC subunit UvrA [SAR202 cluster bacterium]|nr:excinuclease ABC subunit UvrA [SAR202 cluster bacterium]|tara:strand:- start:623 stop:3592 length:2970 start_codon:yes stop_codon:yes gene_type:complete